MDVVATELTSVAKPTKARALMILVIVTELVVNSPYPQSFYLPKTIQRIEGASGNSVLN